MNTTPFFTITQAAKILGLTRQGVWVRIKSGRLPAIRIGHQLAIPAEAISR